MKCPNCNSEMIHVLHTDDMGVYTKRRRECFECGYRFNTIEMAKLPERKNDETHDWRFVSDAEFIS